MFNDDEYKQILTHFPEVEFAFAYGSGVVEQKGYEYDSKKELPMLDFIFVVENSEIWHQKNMDINPNHYSSLIPLGYKSVAAFQDRIPAHFWFNAYVPVPTANANGRLMKYGVINKANAVNDLTHWNNLYIAGRLHKPVRIVVPNKHFDEALRTNRSHAVNTSLLMLPERFSEVDLYLMIASLSYTGDIRMHFGENPKKVRFSSFFGLFCFVLIISVPAFRWLI
jgi:translocator assembly and maintenance protein 41